MFHNVYRRPLSSLLKLLLVCHVLGACRTHDEPAALSPSTLQRLLRVRQTLPPRRLLRIVYFQEFDKTVDENYLKMDVKNLTDAYGMDLKLVILDQPTAMVTRQLCTLIADERRDTIFIADLYTKEVDFLSRSLKIPTITLTNRYQIVQGKLVSTREKRLLSVGLS